MIVAEGGGTDAARGAQYQGAGDRALRPAGLLRLIAVTREYTCCSTPSDRAFYLLTRMIMDVPQEDSAWRSECESSKLGID